MAFDQAINGLNFQNWLSQQVLGSKGVSPEMEFVFKSMIFDELGDGTIVDPIPQPLSPEKPEIYPPVPKDETEGKITEPIDWERIRESYQPEVIPEYGFKPEDFIITDPVPQPLVDDMGIMKSEQSEKPTLEEYVKEKTASLRIKEGYEKSPIHNAVLKSLNKAMRDGRTTIHITELGKNGLYPVKGFSLPEVEKALNQIMTNEKYNYGRIQYNTYAGLNSIDIPIKKTKSQILKEYEEKYGNE
jgi:hypothetical protein